MIMRVFPPIKTVYPKVCFARAGDVLELPEEPGELQLVCCFDMGKPYKPLASNGLYSNENPHFLVNLKTGMAQPMPHLSSRAKPVRDVAVQYCEAE
jgi:hypothetical protein